MLTTWSIAKNITDVKKSAAWVEEKLKKAADKELWTEVVEYTINSL